jgi:LAO/AO transport system kinase
VAEISQMLELNSSFKFQSNQLREEYSKLVSWTPEIAKVNSKTGENFEDLLNIIEKHRKFLEDTGVISNYLKNRIKSETIQILKHKLQKKVEDLIYSNQDEIEQYINEVINKSLDPYSMADLIIKMLGIEK